MKIINNTKNLALASLLCFTASAQSQVTIGSDIEPLKGSLLELKQFKDEPNGANSKKGMVFSRVCLSNLNELYPMLTGSEQGYNETLKPSHTGLTVYNVCTTAPFSKGLYIWDGAKWTRMGADMAVKNGLSLSGSNTIKWGGVLEENTTIDLTGNDLTFKTAANSLGKKGKLKLNWVNNAATNANVAQLAVDNTSGEVVAIKSSSGNSKLFNYVKYVIKCSPSKPDWINNFDTKIPVQDYTVFVIGSQFNTSDPGTIGLEIDTSNMGTMGTFGPATVAAFKEDGTNKYTTWRLKADFATATTADGLPGEWEIHCIIINNTIAQQLNNGNAIEYIMPSQNSGNDVPPMPSGL